MSACNKGHVYPLGAWHAGHVLRCRHCGTERIYHPSVGRDLMQDRLDPPGQPMIVDAPQVLASVYPSVPGDWYERDDEPIEKNVADYSTSRTAMRTGD